MLELVGGTTQRSLGSLHYRFGRLVSVTEYDIGGVRIHLS